MYPYYLFLSPPIDDTCIGFLVLFGYGYNFMFPKYMFEWIITDIPVFFLI